jgi:Flp pilus assembly protein TadG
MIRRRRSSGSALIEFAGSLILLSAVFAGIFQIGYTLFIYQNLVHAIQAGARYASRQDFDATVANPELAKSVRNMVVYGEPAPAPGSQAVVAGLTPEQVELTLVPGAATVSVRGFEIDSLFAKTRLDGRPTVTFPFTGGVSQ